MTYCRPSATRSLGLAFATWVGLSTPSIAAAGNFTGASLEPLLDALTTIDRAAPGISETGVYGAFIADDAPAEFQGGVLGTPPPSIPSQMRALVRRGVTALPVLISHLNDRRPTQLIVGRRLTAGGGFLMWGYFGEEYDPRFERDRKIENIADIEQRMKSFPDRYTVKVGDVCFALIGQIVNRRLTPVRYQPTAGIVVNSPIESPDLIARVSKDWSNLTASQHRVALLADIAAARRTYQFAPAFTRLRFYYPAVYRSLSGLNAEKRNAFEMKNQTYVSPQ
jgi:hypothetical protein